MNELIKIIVTDSGGETHEFPELAGEVENYLNLRPVTPEGATIPCAVSITTRTFAGGPEYDTEVETTFISPRRVDVIYFRKECGS